MIRNARRIDYVTDWYPDTSIKNTERNWRSVEGSLLVKITGRNQRRPQQWKRFLACGKNKSALIEFLCEDTSAEAIAHRELYVAVNNDCYKLTSEDGTVIKELQQDLVSPQEEADTRMFLHAAHASQQGYETIVIKSPDTDVGVLTVYYSRRISGSLILATGAGNKRRFIDINGISEKYGENTCEALLGLHAITGCDSSVGAFSGKGKQSAIKVILKGQLKRWDKLTYIARFQSPENSLEEIFEKFVFVFEIWAVDISFWKSSFLLIRNVRSFGTVSHTQRNCDVRHDLWVLCIEDVSPRCTRWSLEFFKFYLNMASLNKDSSQKDILDDEINIIVVNVTQNDLRPYMSELTNATMMDLTQMSTEITQKISIPWPITRWTDCIDNAVQIGSK